MARRFFPWPTLAASFMAIMFPLCATSQVRGITVSPGTEISSDSPQNPHVESFLAINPRNPSNLIATSMVIEHGDCDSAVYASFDGGKTWKRARATPENRAIFQDGDPVVYFNSQGTAFFAAHAHTLLVSRSRDGGLTWGPTVAIPGGIPSGVYDREYMAFDNTGGTFSGRIYVGGSVFPSDTNGNLSEALEFAYSTDGGRTFSAGHVVVGSPGGDKPGGITDLLIAPDGTLVVPFHTMSPGVTGSRRCGNIWMTVSRDGGNTFLPARRGPAYCRPEGNGYTYVRSMGVPHAAIDLSHGPHRGRVYVGYLDFDGNEYTLKVVHTDDLGNTWSAPVTVSDNTNTDSLANPAIAVNGSGIVGLVWNDRRDDPKDSCFRLYFAASDDGGDTFLPNVRASNEPTCPTAAANWPPFAISVRPVDILTARQSIRVQIITAPARWSNGGETQGLAAGPDGAFRSAYIDGNGPAGAMQLWYKEFHVDPRALPRSALSAGRTNLTQKLDLEVGDPRINFAAHTLSLRVRLVNPLTTPVAGPFSVVLDKLEFTGLKDLHVANAENGLPGKGASWNFPVSDGVLQPKQGSAWRELEWGFSGGRPSPPSAPLSVLFLILGQEK